MIEAYKKFWTNYANFKDRSTVSDYWWVVLCNFLIGFILGFITGFLPEFSGFLKLISSIYSLAVIVPTLALCVRRLHDINKSGWYYLMVLIPLVGWIIMIVYFCTGSVNENNNYGSQV